MDLSGQQERFFEKLADLLDENRATLYALGGKVMVEFEEDEDEVDPQWPIDLNQAIDLIAQG